MVPFSLIWIYGVADLFSGLGLELWSVLRSGEWNLTNGIIAAFSVIPIGFLLVGAYLLLGRFLVDTHRRKNTYYGLTDKRAIFINRCGVKSIPITKTLEFKLQIHTAGIGTLQFGYAPCAGPFDQRKHWRLEEDKQFSFERIEGAEEVYRHAKMLPGLW